MIGDSADRPRRGPACEIVVSALLILSGCAGDSASLSLVLGPRPRDGLVVQCSGEWRAEEEYAFQLSVRASCGTKPPLTVTFYDELGNPLADECLPAVDEGRSLTLMAGREEPSVIVCRKLPKRSMQVTIEAQASCDPPSTAKVSAKADCVVQ